MEIALTGQENYKILVVCMGNICRSPTAEAVLKAKVKARGLAINVDSAGTIDFHQGNPPDVRSRSAGEARGYSFSGIKSRKVTLCDFEEFDLILAADNSNLDDLIVICPPQYHSKIALYLSYGTSNISEIPDPYYGGSNGFEIVLDLIEDATDVLLDSFQKG
ncbi:low molecular weight protein-tyrosine-phosphatase [Photobacterium profundum]|uniref:Phosphotyrosine protein phosphatase n=1 Tax=Photobacterium profundum (strain SS9) TaxID=298386 RepID=Q6LSY1_PHOPR|nr:low molecular weight protein-tyrosine-phosphatase [Photobacterium profundum]CAG19595.1 Putative phosphotyrosine protein phosphatase [Photobacterium profundum SS9]